MDDSQPQQPTVTLRPVEPEDLPTFFEHQSEPAANEMAAFPSRSWQAFTNHWNKILANPANFNRTILANDQIAGHIASYPIEDQREVGYWLGQRFWGQGIATQALAAFLREDARRPLYAHVIKHNVGSRRVLEKCGFVVCGEERSESDTDGKEIAEWILKLDAN